MVMSTGRTCSNCGAPLTGESVFKGLCPRCLLGIGIDGSELPTEVTKVRDEVSEAQSSQAWLSEGQILGNRYEIHSLLGRGGMGEVWHAFDVKLRVDVALKALRAEYFESEKRRELLREEVRSAREVLSPNVCRVFDLVELDGKELVSMEYIDGTTLLKLLENRGPLSHLLLGLSAVTPTGGPLAVSPDGRWIAGAGGNEIRLWPMPDLTKPPLHTLPLDQLLAKLHELTNLQVVEDEAGYRLEVGPFPGWKNVPTW